MREQIEESKWILSCQRLKWGCMYDLCCHLFIFAVVADFVTELATEDVLSDLLYANDSPDE